MMLFLLVVTRNGILDSHLELILHSVLCPRAFEQYLMQLVLVFQNIQRAIGEHLVKLGAG